MGKLWEPGEQYEQARRFRKRAGSAFAKIEEPPKWKTRVLQGGASLLIFLLIWGIYQFDSPGFISAQAKIREWFTKDYDIQPVLRLLTDVGVWGDTFDRAAFDTMKIQDSPGPLTVPVSGQVTGPFGWITGSDQSKQFNDGIIIAAPEGTQIKAALAGVVTRIANEEEKGRVLEIAGDNNYLTAYAHCKEILVNLGDKVVAGQVIAKVGKTGKCAHPQLYFRIMKNGDSLDPAQYFISPGDKT